MICCSAHLFWGQLESLVRPRLLYRAYTCRRPKKAWIHLKASVFIAPQGKVFYFLSTHCTQGGLLDGEAYARGTTVYLQDRRLDMLPSLLSEHLCSLRSGVDRCAVSVLWTLNADYSIDDIWFGRSIIRWVCNIPVLTFPN